MAMDRTTFIRDHWIPALASGAYQQGTGGLRADTPEGTRWCCLGVATECALRLGLIAGDWTDDTLFGHRILRLADGWSVYDYLPDALAAFLEMDREGQLVPGEHVPAAAHDTVMTTLAQLNDEGYTFAQIVALLRREVAGEPVLEYHG